MDDAHGIEHPMATSAGPSPRVVESSISPGPSAPLSVTTGCRPLPLEEAKAWSEQFRAAMEAIDAEDRDPPGSDEEFLKGIDSHRPEGSKLFEGLY